MKYKLNNIEYNVEIIKKNNKHTYIRIKDDFTILVTTNYFVSKNSIKDLLNNNQEELLKMIDKKEKSQLRANKFYLLGKNYDLVIDSNIKKIEIENKKLYVSSEKYLKNWIKREMKTLFLKRLEYNYKLFEEKIPFPNLKIREMKTRWGVCNKKLKTVTLNSKLIREDISKIDYVIIHELSHFIHFDHSKEFWNTVSKYCPDYKKIRKELKEGE